MAVSALAFAFRPAIVSFLKWKTLSCVGDDGRPLKTSADGGIRTGIDPRSNIGVYRDC